MFLKNKIIEIHKNFEVQYFVYSFILKK